MELNPLGPVLFIDTAGVDDEGTLGEERIKKTKKIYSRTDIGIIVTENKFGNYEEKILKELSSVNIPVIIVFNKTDLNEISEELLKELKYKKIKFVKTSVKNNTGIEELKKELTELIPQEYKDSPSILGDLVGSGEMAILVVPIDKEAPKGRLILPQVQSIRDLLDSDAFCMVVKERELTEALNRLNKPPKLVVTDSQVFLKVDGDVPPEIPLTSFSVLFSRFRGDLLTQAKGAMSIDSLKTGDKILVAEACSHHPGNEDIARVKIPRWLTQYVGGKLDFTTITGHDFPEDLSTYKLIIHCGACMMNKREVMTRINRSNEVNVPITNYGLVIAKSLGILNRALSPFPGILDILKEDHENLY